jgi:hypothetical protein
VSIQGYKGAAPRGARVARRRRGEDGDARSKDGCCTDKIKMVQVEGVRRFHHRSSSLLQPPSSSWSIDSMTSFMTACDFGSRFMAIVRCLMAFALSLSFL